MDNLEYIDFSFTLDLEEEKKLNRKNGRELSDNKLYTINFSHLRLGWETSPPPLFQLCFTLNRNYIRNICLKLNQPCINIQSVCWVRHSWIGNKTENYNYNWAESPNKYWFWQIFIFFQNYQHQKEKGRRRETMTRRRIKSEFFCISWIQFIWLKIQKKKLLKKSYAHAALNYKTDREPVLRHIRVTPLGLCIRVIVSKKNLKLMTSI